MLDLLWRSVFRWRLQARARLTGDTAYGTTENIAAVEQADIRRLRAAERRGQGPALTSVRSCSPTIPSVTSTDARPERLYCRAQRTRPGA